MLSRLVKRLAVLLVLLSPLRLLAGTAKRVRASYYAPKFAGRKTSTGERYDPKKLTVANRTLPFGTRLLICRENARRCIVAVVNDRGPWNKKFGLDLSWASAQALGITKGMGWAWVNYEEIHANQ